MIVSDMGGLADEMTGTFIGYARCSTDRQDLAAQRAALEALGVTPDRVYVDHSLSGTTRARPDRQRLISPQIYEAASGVFP